MDDKNAVGSIRASPDVVILIEAVIVALPTLKPPHIKQVIQLPNYGITLRKFIITVPPQKLICPHGKH